MKYDLNLRNGIIILRHVKNDEQNKLWKLSYECVRKIYPKMKVMIVDDNSDYNYITGEEDLINTTIIKSEYPGRGEILPYYYLYKTRMFDKALIIHDTCYILKHIDLDSMSSNIRFLWYVDGWYDTLLEGNNHIPEMNEELITYLNDSDKLLKKYKEEEHAWLTCFGLMSIVKLSFIDTLECKYKLFNTMNYIKKRFNRSEMERVFGLLCGHEDNNLLTSGNHGSINGSIHHYINTYGLWPHMGEDGFNKINKMITNKTMNNEMNMIKLIGQGR